MLSVFSLRSLPENLAIFFPSLINKGGLLCLLTSCVKFTRKNAIVPLVQREKKIPDFQGGLAVYVLIY